LPFDVCNLVFVRPVLEQDVQQSNQVASENKRGPGVEEYKAGGRHGALISRSLLASKPRATQKIRSEWVPRSPDLLNQTQSFINGLSMQRVSTHNCWQHNLTST